MKIREQTAAPLPGSSGATVKAGVTKDDARYSSKQHAISRTFVTTPGETFRQNTLKCEEMSLATYIM